jgi:hypothetical protein
VKTISDELKNWKCKLCNDTNYHLKRVKMHIGVYCNSCNTWNRWINQDRLCETCKFWVLKRKNHYCTFRINIDDVDDINIDLCKYRFKGLMDDFDEWR